MIYQDGLQTRRFRQEKFDIGLDEMDLRQDPRLTPESPPDAAA